MSTVGMMRRARRLYLSMMLALFVPAAFAQTPPARDRDDLDVTMRVIVDPNAKVPDEIVHKISLPKPAAPGTSPENKNDGKQKDNGKPADPGAQGKGNSADARGQGREFGQQVSEDARQRSEEARREHGKPDTPEHPQPPEHPEHPQHP